jgi:hypothetical protein
MRMQAWSGPLGGLTSDCDHGTGAVVIQEILRLLTQHAPCITYQAPTRHASTYGTLAAAGQMTASAHAVL